jgi:signal transduction histidine kinase
VASLVDVTDIRHAAAPERSPCRAGTPSCALAHFRSRLMRSMLGDLSLLAQVEAGELEVRPEAVELRAFLLDCVQRWKGELEVERVRVEGPRDPCRAHADPDHLDRILRALLSNALKFSPGGSGVVVECGTEAAEAWFAVRDRGAGLRPAEVERLFRRFARGENASGTEGLGLGLYLARILAEAMGGRLVAGTADGTGSTFEVRLRAAATAAGARRRPAEASP